MAEEQKPNQTAEGQAGAAQAYNLGGDPGGSVPRASFLQKIVSENEGSGIKINAPIVQAPGTAAAPNSGGNGNSFTRLFGSKDAALNAQATLHKSVLGPRPIRETLKEQREELEAAGRTARTIFLAIFLVAAIGFGYLQSQLSEDFTMFSDLFGPNLAQKFVESNSEIIRKQTELNITRLSRAQLLLDRVSQLADRWELHMSRATSPTLSEQGKSTALGAAALIRTDIVKALEEVKAMFGAPLHVELKFLGEGAVDAPTQFKDALVAELTQRRAALAQSREKNADEIRQLTNRIKLAENSVFRTHVAALDMAQITDVDLREIVKTVREEGSDDLSLVADIKNERVSWTEIIRDIELVSKEVDPTYGQGFFDEIGGVRYSGFTFNATDGRITLQGETKTIDTSTFTLVADLIDAFERSDSFEEVLMRTFTKGKTEGGYSSTLQLSFILENPLKGSEADGAGATN